MNLDQLFQESAARHPNHPAIIKVAGERLSYAELDQRIEQIAGELQQRGVTTGITVGLHCDSGLDYTIVRPGALTDDLGMGKVKLAEKLDVTGEIPRDDVAFLLIMSLADPLVKNMTFEAVEGEEPIKSAMIELSRG